MTESAPALPLSDFDLGVRVQDDLYRHVNGGWLARAEIPADQPLAGSFVDLRNRAEAAVRDIITGIGEQGPDTLTPGSDEAKIAALYASFMAEDAIEAAGAAPIALLLAEVDAVTGPEDLQRLLGAFARRGVGGLVSIEAESDPGDPNRYVMFAGQDGLGLPDEQYYRDDSYAEIRTKYSEHVAASFAIAGVPDATAAAASVLALETEIAARHWDRVKTRDLRAMYNLRTLEQLTEEAPGLYWRAFLAGAQIPEATMAELVVAQPSFLTEVATLLTDDRMPAWRLWAKWNVISSLSPYLSSAFVAQRFSFYGTVLSGTPQLKERWKRGVALVEGALGEAVGRAYVERHFSPTAKERMDTLVANLIEAYRRSITGLEWMTEATKAEALAKLAKFTPHIGYPSRWRDYSALEVRSDDLVGNVFAATSFELDRTVAKIGAPIDREEWLMTPQTVNAYYHPLRNEIVFPAAILQPPFFNEHADDAVNYGGIGAVIGHEIGHGFDDQGSTCDGNGALRDWWTAEDRAAFETRTSALIEQYDALSPELADGQHVNGRLTIGENIGDLGGLSIAHLAHAIGTGGSAGDTIDDYTPEQRLFLSWGAIWQSKSRAETVLQRLATDPHSPSEFRCNQIVRNLDSFHAAFGVTEGDDLWLAEDQRVKIW